MNIFDKVCGKMGLMDPEDEKEELQGDLKAANDKVKSRKLDEAQLKADLYNLQRQMEKIPPEIVAMYTGKRLNRERGD